MSKTTTTKTQIKQRWVWNKEDIPEIARAKGLSVSQGFHVTHICLRKTNILGGPRASMPGLLLSTLVAATHRRQLFQFSCMFVSLYIGSNAQL